MIPLMWGGHYIIILYVGSTFTYSSFIWRGQCTMIMWGGQCTTNLYGEASPHRIRCANWAQPKSKCELC